MVGGRRVDMMMRRVRVRVKRIVGEEDGGFVMGRVIDGLARMIVTMTGIENILPPIRKSSEKGMTRCSAAHSFSRQKCHVVWLTEVIHVMNYEKNIGHEPNR